MAEALFCRPIDTTKRVFGNPSQPFKPIVVPEREPGLPKTVTKELGWYYSKKPICENNCNKIN